MFILPLGAGRIAGSSLNGQIKCLMNGQQLPPKIGAPSLCTPTRQNKHNHFDWVICLEVAEHIPKEYEETFVNNLVKATPNGIVLS